MCSLVIASSKTTATGYQCLLDWLAGFGPIERIGVESTGTYAAGLTRHLTVAGVRVVEVNTPHSHTRARQGKNDVIDAEAAARKAFTGEATSQPKNTFGVIEAIRILRLARESAVKSRTVALTQLGDVLVTAPAGLRESITAATSRGKATQCARLRPDMARINEPLQAAKFALCGIGTGHASQLLITAGQNIDRLNSDAAFARLCGVAPIPVSSGKTQRMRLHRRGDRQANRALYMIAICRLKYDPRTIAYVQRRTAEGLSKKDVIRCLKRFIAREVYNALKLDLNTA